MLSWLSSKLDAASTRFHALVTRQLVYGVLLGFSISVTSTSLALYFQQRRQERIQEQFEPRPIELRSDEIIDGVTGLIGQAAPVLTCDFCSLMVRAGNTPLVRINSLSNALGVEILGKAEVRISCVLSCAGSCNYSFPPIPVFEPWRKCQRPCRLAKYAFRRVTMCAHSSECLHK